MHLINTHAHMTINVPQTRLHAWTLVDLLRTARLSHCMGYSRHDISVCFLSIAEVQQAW